MGIAGMAVRAAVHSAEKAARDARLAQGADAYLPPHMQPKGSAAVAVRDGDAIDVRPDQVVTAVPHVKLNGARLLADAYTGLRHFAVWPSEAALVTATLWGAQAHAKDKNGLPVWQYSPRLFFTSKEGGSGKSQMTKLALRVAPRGKLLVESSKASLIAFIAEQATVGVTELDVLVGTGTRNRWFTAIANAGFDPETATSKMSGGKKVEIPLFGPMVLDGLDSVINSTGVELRTLMSRCIIIRVKRAPEGYRAPRLDGQARKAFGWVRDQMALWMMQEAADGIGDDVPEVPQGLGNRPASLWEPLFAVADRAGGDWPHRAREACATLEAAAGLPQDEEEEQRHRSTFDAWAAKAAAQADEDDDL